VTDSRFLCRMDSLSCALRAAVKVAGKDEIAYVRLHRLNEHTLSISALGEKASFRAKLKVDFVHWDDERDDRVELSKHAAASLAGYEVKTPDGLDAEPTVSVTIGQERIRVQDETGLFQTAGGRDEHRLAHAVLPGDHEKIFVDAASAPGAPFWIPPETLATISGVAKLLRRRIVMLTRSEPEELTSRWYVLGDDWQMTVSHKEKLQIKQDQENTAGKDSPAAKIEQVIDATARRLVAADPAGGIA